MTLFFPDLNVWLALSDEGHTHSASAWHWLGALPESRRLIFSRFTQVGLLRLLTNAAVMGSQKVNLRGAWEVYDRWLADGRVALIPEPPSLDAEFRHATEHFAEQAAPKAVGDCYLLAYAKRIEGTLVTFDRGLHALARKQGCAAVIPG